MSKTRRKPVDRAAHQKRVQQRRMQQRELGERYQHQARATLPEPEDKGRYTP